MVRSYSILHLCLSVFICGSLLCAEPGPASDSKAAEVSRLLGTLDAEPLVAVYTPNALNLPDLFAKTNVYKMLTDPAYAKGLETLQKLITDGLGADMKLVWPEFSRQMAGAAVLAILPRVTDKPEEDGVFQLAFVVLAKNEDAAAKLKELWPKVPPQANNLLAALSLKTVLAKDLPDASKLPAWASAAGEKSGDIGLFATPRRLGEKLTAFLDQVDDPMEFSSTLPAIAELSTLGIERVMLWTTFSGENFSEELRIEVSPDKGNNTVAHLASALKEQPNKFDSLHAAMPGGEDVLLLLQLEPEGLGKDLPLALNAMERFLRGKKWSRGKGRDPEALAPDRFKFILDKLQGTIGISAHPAISGELRLCATAALRNDAHGDLRDELVKGLANVGADFQTLNNARKIGNSPPLGATFPGRGVFSAPMIGLSPGWLWLCSNSAAYQDLTTTFKTGKTLAADLQKEQNKEAARRAPDWRDGDAARIQIEMEKVVRLGYTAWLLSGDEGPFLLGWKVPADMLPPPAIFSNRLGLLRAGAKRQGGNLEAYSYSVLPGTALGLVALLQQMAGDIEVSRKIAEEIKAGPDARSEKEPAPQALPVQEKAPAAP
ncbi:MAG TPA: hypothetical protein VEJ63_11010 [Planctomycetota bacterium]|nr:hypothetical protein [Planctomycetota bacterium]